MKLKSSLLGLALVAGFAAQANATTINPTGCCGEKSLQTILDDITVGGPSSVDVDTDQVGADQYWQIGGSGGAVSTFIMEITAGASTQTFGIFDRANPSNYVELFDGGATSGDQVLMSILGDGSVLKNFVDTGIDFAGNNFGFYLGHGGGPQLFSDENLNPGGEDKFVAFQGQGDQIQIDPFSAGPWSANEFIFGVEDGNDNDFQDLVALVESVSPVPEPGTLALLGLGLAGVGVSAARRRKSA